MKIVFFKFISLVRHMQILVCNILLNILSVMRLLALSTLSETQRSTTVHIP